MPATTRRPAYWDALWERKFVFCRKKFIRINYALDMQTLLIKLLLRAKLSAILILYEKGNDGRPTHCNAEGDIKKYDVSAEM